MTHPDEWNESEEGPEIDPPKPCDTITKFGDVWKLGEHRILCGSSCDTAAVEALMAGDRADMVATDPPYGVDYVGKTKDALTVMNDSKDGLEDLLTRSLGTALSVSKPGAVWYVACPPGPPFHLFLEVIRSMGIWRQTISWVKNCFVMGNSDFHYRHEAIIYGWAPGGPHRKPPDRKQDTVWEFKKPSRSPDHPTTKPVGMYVRMCLLSTARNDVVYEPFSGSGTTILACEQVYRKCRAVELNPAYVDVAVKRWEAVTGKKAEIIFRRNETGTVKGEN